MNIKTSNNITNSITVTRGLFEAKVISTIRYDWFQSLRPEKWRTKVLTHTVLNNCHKSLTLVAI